MFKLNKKKILHYSVFCFLLLFIFSFISYEPKIKFISEKFYLMGTHGKIQIFVDDIESGNIAIKNAINRIKNIENLLTKFSPYSEISKINKYPFINNYISRDTVLILHFGQLINVLTDGYFDIGIGNILSVYGIDYVPAMYNYIISNNFKYKLFDFLDNKSIKLIRNNTMLDLGGIGKGFAIDEAMKTLSQFGVQYAAIEFGGDIKVNGTMPSGKPWIITFDNKLLLTLKSELNYVKLNNNSIAISGGYLKKAQTLGLIKHHIINPKSLNSNNKYLCMIVNGKQNTICDAIATGSYNMDYISLCKLKLLLSKYKIKTYF